MLYPLGAAARMPSIENVTSWVAGSVRDLNLIRKAMGDGRSLSLSTNIRPRTTTELFGEEICVIPGGMVSFEPGPLTR